MHRECSNHLKSSKQGSIHMPTKAEMLQEEKTKVVYIKLLFVVHSRHQEGENWWSMIEPERFQPYTHKYRMSKKHLVKSGSNHLRKRWQAKNWTNKSTKAYTADLANKGEIGQLKNYTAQFIDLNFVDLSWFGGKIAQSAGGILTQNNCPGKNSFRIHF